MKKSISLILVLAFVIAAFAFVGCGSENTGNAGTEQDDNALNLTVVVPSAFGDKSLNDAAHDGAEKIKELGVNVNYIECQGEAYKQQMMQAAGNSDIVVCVGWEFWQITDVASEYPNVKFVWIDYQVENPEEYPNLLNVRYAQNEGSYLAGYIAAAMSETGVIGVVGGEDTGATNDFIAGYEQGAKAYNSRIRVRKKYAGGEIETAELGRKLAEAVNKRKADVVFQITGNTGEGIFEAASKRGFMAIGVDKDQKIERPEYDDVILCSMKKEVGLSVHDILRAYVEDGTFNGGKVWVADMANGYIDISYGDENSKQLVSDELKAEVKAIKQKIINGEIKVDTTRD